MSLLEGKRSWGLVYPGSEHSQSPRCRRRLESHRGVGSVDWWTGECACKSSRAVRRPSGLEPVHLRDSSVSGPARDSREDAYFVSLLGRGGESVLNGRRRAGARPLCHGSVWVRAGAILSSGLECRGRRVWKSVYALESFCRRASRATEEPVWGCRSGATARVERRVFAGSGLCDGGGASSVPGVSSAARVVNSSGERGSPGGTVRTGGGESGWTERDNTVRCPVRVERRGE